MGRLQLAGFLIFMTLAISACGMFWGGISMDGGSSGSSASATLKAKSGTYVGDASILRSFTGLGFAPDMVIIKGDQAATAFGMTSTMPAGNSKDMFNNGPLVAGEISSLDADGFTVTGGNEVNGAAINYYWVAVKALAGFSKVGSYVGDGLDNRSITGLGFQPDSLIILPAGAFSVTWRTSAMPADFCLNTAFLNQTDAIQAFEADGFQLGTNGEVNTAAQTYHYIAWKASPGYAAVGSYTGNGVDNRSITGVGFQPEYIWLQRSAVSLAVHKTASTGVATDTTLALDGIVNFANGLQALEVDGFQVGTNAKVNTGAATYYWFGLKLSQ